MVIRRQKMTMLVNSVAGETRVAICRDGRLEELWVEHSDQVSPVGNIYKGRVTNVERSLQAAFIDCGFGKEGFLHVSDILPRYFPKKRKNERIGNRTRRSDRPTIESCLRRGDEVIVQVIKDGFGHKGPALSTYISLPGRMLVMLPYSTGSGVSRRVVDIEKRRELKKMLAGMRLSKEAGFILRTAGNTGGLTEFQADAKYLVELWEKAERRMKRKAPTEVLHERGLVTQILRDRWTKDFDQVIVDSREDAAAARAYLKATAPRIKRKLVTLHTGSPIFEKYGIESDVEGLAGRSAPLPSGGHIVIDQTEALVAVDVNSGRTKSRNSEDTALKTNLEAATEVARQLRLRDLGGLVVVDFIDMVSHRNRVKVEETLSKALAQHREKAQVLPMSEFGIIEITRQRSRQSVAAALHATCPQCSGSGKIESLASSVASILRQMRSAISANPRCRIRAMAPTEIVTEVFNRHREEMDRLESLAGAPVELLAGGRTDVSIGQPATHGGKTSEKPSGRGNSRKRRRRRKSRGNKVAKAVG